MAPKRSRLHRDLGGYATAFTGVSAVIVSPIVGKLSAKVDPRILVCFGILWLGLTALLRTRWESGADFWSLALPQLWQGIGMPFFFVPITALGLSAVEPEELASAAGLMSFLRTMSGAIGTSIVTTSWDDDTRVARSELVGKLHTGDAVGALQAQGVGAGQIRGVIEQLVNGEAAALATNHIFIVSAMVFAFAAALIWVAPKPARQVAPGSAH